MLASRYSPGWPPARRRMGQGRRCEERLQQLRHDARPKLANFVCLGSCSCLLRRSRPASPRAEAVDEIHSAGVVICAAGGAGGVGGGSTGSGGTGYGSYLVDSSPRAIQLRCALFKSVDIVASALSLSVKPPRCFWVGRANWRAGRFTVASQLIWSIIAC